MVPLSSYALPCQVPLYVIGLPTFQSDTASVPKRNCLIIAGSVRAFQTFPAGDLIVTRAVATNEPAMDFVPPRLGLPCFPQTLPKVSKCRWQGQLTQ